MSEVLAVSSWFLPALLVALTVGVLLAPLLQRVLAVRRRAALAIVLALGLILAATLAPLPESSARQASFSCDLSRIGPLSWTELTTLNDSSLNVLLFVPLGVATGVIFRSPHGRRLIMASLVLPVVIEAVQLFLPGLGRGCQSADVFDNISGLLVGQLVGAIIDRH